MTLRKKDIRFHTKSTAHIELNRHSSSFSPQYFPSDNSNSNILAGRGFLSPVTHRNKPLQGNIFDDNQTSRLLAVHRSFSPKSRTRLPPVSVKKAKSDSVFIPCVRHGKECVKFVDTSEGKFEGLCDLCMVSSEFAGKNMKLERLVSIYERKRSELLKTQQELQELENTISKLYKDIVKTNVMMAPLMKEMDEMQKKVVVVVDRCFTMLKAKFIKFNPFKDTREDIREKIEDSLRSIEMLEAGNLNSFKVLQSLYDEKTINANKHLIYDLKNKIEMNTMTNPLLEKDFGALVYGYEKFFERIEGACRQFAQVVKVAT